MAKGAGVYAGVVMKEIRRRFLAEEEIRIVLEDLRGKESIARSLTRKSPPV